MTGAPAGMTSAGDQPGARLCADALRFSPRRRGARGVCAAVVWLRSEACARLSCASGLRGGGAAETWGGGAATGSARKRSGRASSSSAVASSDACTLSVVRGRFGGGLLCEDERLGMVDLFFTGRKETRPCRNPSGPAARSNLARRSGGYALGGVEHHHRARVRSA